MEMPGFYFCVCPDGMLAREHVRSLLAGPAGAGEKPEERVFWADEGLDGRFWEALTMPSFGRRPEALLLRGAHGLPADAWKKLSAALAAPRPDVLPVFFLESAWEKGRAKLPAHLAKARCLAFAEQRSWVWRNPGLDARALRPYLAQKAGEMGLTLRNGVLERLGEISPPDAAAASRLLEQLALAAPDGIVDEALTGQMAGHTPEVILFDFIRHLQNGNAFQVWKTLLGAGDGGESLLFPLLALLTREARILWQILAGENVWLPQQIAGAKRSLAARLGCAGVAEIFRAALEAEQSVKSGRKQAAQAMEELTAGLVLLFAPEKPAAKFPGRAA
jgi:DNA polymerase-3 subunit delta